MGEVRAAGYAKSMRTNGPMSLPPMPAPTWVNLESTLGCNLGCVMCGSHLSGATQARGVMADVLIAQVEREVLPAAQDLSLTVAGEPFMTPRIVTFVELSERSGTKLQLNTNGTLIKDSPLLRRVMCQSSVIKFSVDGARPETYERIRVGADFKEVMDNIRLVVHLREELPAPQRPRLVMATVLMRQNLDELVGLVDLAHDLGLDGLEIAHMTVLTEAMDGESLRHTPEAADKAFAAARARADSLGFSLALPPRMDGHPIKVSLGARARGWVLRASGLSGARVWRGLRAVRNRAQIARWERAAGGSVPCRFLRSGTFITIGGDVTPCPMPGRPVAGNLAQTPFPEIWNGEVLTAMRRGFLEGKPMHCCAHCSQNPTGYVPSDEDTVRPLDTSLPEWFARPDAMPSQRG